MVSCSLSLTKNGEKQVSSIFLAACGIGNFLTVRKWSNIYERYSFCRLIGGVCSGYVDTGEDWYRRREQQSGNGYSYHCGSGDGVGGGVCDLSLRTPHGEPIGGDTPYLAPQLAIPYLIRLGDGSVVAVLFLRHQGGRCEQGGAHRQVQPGADAGLCRAVLGRSLHLENHCRLRAIAGRDIGYGAVEAYLIRSFFYSYFKIR